MFAANLDSVLIRMIGSPCLSQWYKFLKKYFIKRLLI